MMEAPKRIWRDPSVREYFETPPLDEGGGTDGLIEYVRADLSGWRDISTAPKDGTRVLVYSPDDATSFACAFEAGTWQTGVWRAKMAVPSHWMPLPDPPEDA